MAEWFARAFDAVVGEARSAISDIRHELLGGWFGRNFEPHPMRKQGDLGWTRPYDEKGHEPESQKPEREHGIDR